MLKSLLGLLFFVSLYGVDAKEIYSSKEVILKKQNDYYTIVLATVLQDQYHNKIIDDNAVAYSFGQKNKYVKVLFGAYKTYEDASNSLVKLDTTLLVNRPYNEKINKHINLFYKYQNQL